MITAAIATATNRSRAQERNSSRKEKGFSGVSSFKTPPSAASFPLANIIYNTAAATAPTEGYLWSTACQYREMLLVVEGEKANVAAEAKRKAGTGIVMRQAGQSGNIPLEPAGDNLKSYADLRGTFRADQRRADFSRRIPAKHFSGKVHPAMKRIGERAAISQHVVLRKQTVGRLQNPHAESAEGVQLSEMLLENEAGEYIRGVEADAAGLVGVGDQITESARSGGAMTALTPQTDLGVHGEAAHIVGGIGTGENDGGERGYLLSDIQKILHRALQLDFNDAANAHAQVQDAQGGEIAGQAGNRIAHILQEVKTHLGAHHTGGNSLRFRGLHRAVLV